MTGNKCLLDTSIIINTFKNVAGVAERLNEAAFVYVPVIVAGELYFGAHRSGQAEKHLAQIASFLQNCILVPIDEDTAAHYGRIKATLSDKGRPIPENDIWIAACALQHRLPLYTNDAHFKEIEGLELLG